MDARLSSTLYKYLYSLETKTVIMNLIDDGEKITQGFMNAINLANIELFRIIKTNFKKVEPYFSIIEFIIERLSTVTDLAIRGYNWDAEIIYRCALEGFIKFTYMVMTTEEEREKRLKEYWDELFEINAIKISEQAKKSLTVHNYNDTSRLAFKPMVLNDDLEAELRKKWPRVERKKLEQKWSFSEMAIDLAKDNKAFIGFLHNYRYASHVSHADETGVLMIKERSLRSKEEREIADMAHYIRLLSDSFFFCASMGIHVCLISKIKATFFSELAESISDISELGMKYLEKLQEDKIYDRFK